jgi:hypothetical protein
MTDAQRELHQALKAHQSDLETEPDAASHCGLKDRIEAIRRVLEWLDEQALNLRLSSKRPRRLGGAPKLMTDPERSKDPPDGSTKQKYRTVKASEFAEGDRIDGAELGGELVDDVPIAPAGRCPHIDAV